METVEIPAAADYPRKRTAIAVRFPHTLLPLGDVANMTQSSREKLRNPCSVMSVAFDAADAMRGSPRVPSV